MLTEKLKRQIRRYCGPNLERMHSATEEDAWDEENVFTDHCFYNHECDCILEALEYAATLTDDPAHAFDNWVGFRLLSCCWYGSPRQDMLDAVSFLLEHGADPMLVDSNGETAYDRLMCEAAGSTVCDGNALESNWYEVLGHAMKEHVLGLDQSTARIAETVVGQKLQGVAFVGDKDAGPFDSCRGGMILPENSAVILRFETNDLVYCRKTWRLVCDNAYRAKYDMTQEADCDFLKGLVGRRLGSIRYNVKVDKRACSNRFALCFDGADASGRNVICLDAKRGRKSVYRVGLRKPPKWLKNANSLDNPYWENND